ncbi:MAG: SRPBCC domain-containing protein [Solirubrobacteraceae bacterium]
MTAESGYAVHIERTFSASAEAVFDAWTSPEVMRRWLHCRPDWDTPEAEVDLRVGGKVRVVMRKPDRTKAEARGEYVLIDRPHRLVMTWTFGDDPTNEQLIELSFTEAAGETTVVLVNSRISTDQRREGQDWGWQGCLEELDRLLAG